VETYTQITNAILLLGHKPDLQGRIQEGVKIRANLAACLYRNGIAPVIIPSGWYWPKDDRLKAFREARIVEKYLHEEHGDDINTLCEPFSTSIPENLLFTRVIFPNLQRLTIVVGQLFEARVRFLAEKTFGNTVQLRIETCNDGLSDVQNEKRLLTNVKCIVSDITPDTILQLMLKPDDAGNLRSQWTALNEAHKRSCPLHT